MLYAADAVFQHYSIRKVYIFTIGIEVQVNLIDHDEDFFDENFTLSIYRVTGCGQRFGLFDCIYGQLEEGAGSGGLGIY